MSIRPDLRGGPFSFDWSPTLENYQKVFASESFLPLLLTSARVAAVVAVLATLLSFPLAYFLVMRVKRRAVLLLTLLIIPFWVSYLLRIISWKIILGSNGALNSLLASLGLVDESAAVLLYSRSAVIVTLVYLWLPFAALPIYAALLRIDRSLLEAAADLGATPAQRFRRITLPLALPGILVAFFMVFIPTVGEYLTPLLVGGDEGTLYGNIINLFFAQGTNWPQGSALALIMLAAIGVVIAVLARVVGLRRVVEEL